MAPPTVVVAAVVQLTQDCVQLAVPCTVHGRAFEGQAAWVMLGVVAVVVVVVMVS